MCVCVCVCVSVIQACLLCLLRGSVALPLNCADESSSPVPCTSISQDKLLDRVTQHAEFIYRITEERAPIFEHILLLIGVHLATLFQCKVIEVAWMYSFPSDMRLLHYMLILAQSWVEPLTYLQSSLKNNDHAPDTLVSQLKWVSDKLTRLEQGVVLLISMEGGAAPPPAALQQALSEPQLGVPDSIFHEYNSLMCLKKDAHKMETLLKLLKCRQTDRLSCTL
uniref:Somatolactin alpha n=1 Tax=Electrophorus electricus TaxID=8005 RepID=A0A4W4HJL4_ELEEL